MFKKIFSKEANLRKHLEAPLLKEREEFLLKMEKKGLCLRYFQIVSKYLLFAVQVLNLKDNVNEHVSFEDILKAGQKWKKMKLFSPQRKNFNPNVDTKTKEFLCTTVIWLSNIGRIAPSYWDKRLIFNRICDTPAFKLKYFGTSFFKERLIFLNYLEANGISFSRLREYAEYQIHIISFFNLKALRMFSKSELFAASEQWDALSSTSCIKGKRYKTFHAVAYNWFDYLGLIKSEDDNIAEADKLNEYCHWTLKNRGVSVVTIKGRRSELNHFTMFLSQRGCNIKSLNIFCLDAYIKMRHNEGCGRRSIAKIIFDLKDFLRFAYNHKMIQTDLSFFLKSPRIYSLEGLPTSPKWGNVQRLINHYDGNTPRNIRNKAILILLAVYGIRCSELCNLTLNDIDWENDIIYLHRVKGCRSQILPLLPIVGNALTKYITEARRNDLKRKSLFLDLLAPFTQVKRTTIYQVVSGAYKSLNIKLNHIGPHSLRHACATHLINAGHTLKEVSDLLGHKRFDTTRIYAKVDMVNLRKVSEMNWEELI
ncbi:MAG: tyrosine-type recombinase/integrase [Bacteroidaceae bacterium]